MIHGIDFKKDDCFKEVKRGLIRLIGDSRRATKDDSDTYAIKQIEERIADVIEGMAIKQRKKANKRT